MKVDKPWGWYNTLTPEQTALFRGYLVKELHVKKGHRLSLQRHQHRSEHWIVVNGEGIFESDDCMKLVSEGTYLYIPKGSTHRLTARDQDIRIVEIQCGEIISEEDIERIEDDYSRTTPQQDVI
jgi:mannose-6-phosphate isomerase